MSAAIARGQSADVPLGQPVAGEVRAIKEIGPELFYLENDAGGLVPVPGFRYRDFVDLMRLKDRLPMLPELPSAVLESITLTATLPDAGDASISGTKILQEQSICAVKIELVVRQSRAGWVNVPVELAGLLLTTLPRHEGPGKVLLTPAASTTQRLNRGYQAWFESGSDQSSTSPVDVRHTVILEGKIPLDVSPTDESIAIHLPIATASLVELRTSRTEPVVAVRPRSLEPRIEKLSSGDGSLITLVGLAGPTQIRIGTRQSQSVSVGMLPQATVESIVRVDGKVVITEAVLRLEDLPALVSTLSISLPPRAKLRSVRPPAVIVDRSGSDDAPVAVVRIDRNADGRALVELDCERLVDRAGTSPFETLGFAVADIPLWRQSGRTSIIVEGDWQVEWDDLGTNRRIDPPLVARRPGFVAAFAYDSQPASLLMRVRPRGSRVVIEPEYRYEVGATRIALTATLRVSVRGAPISRIVIGMDGWDVDEVGPASIVDTAAITGDGGTLVIPFVQGLSGDAVLEIRCGRSIESTADRIAWQVPLPQADLVGPASVVIVSESDIELIPDSEAMRGLVRQVFPASQRSDADKITLAYRADSPTAVFKASRRFLPRRITATMAAQLDINESDTVVDQTIRFTVAHVPMEFVELLVPDAVVQSGTLEVRQNGQLLNPSSVPFADGLEPSGAPAAEGMRVRSMLPTPLLGTGELSLRYQLPTPSVPPETTVAEDIPLIIPMGAKIGRQTISMIAEESLSIDVRSDSWKRDIRVPTAALTRVWIATKPQEIIPLAIAARQQSFSGETFIEAAWLETRLFSDGREDSFAYAITTTSNQITLTLPQRLQSSPERSLDARAIEVWIDGRLVRDAVRSNGLIVIDVPAGKEAAAWLLEVRARRPRAGSLWGNGFLSTGLMPLQLDAPIFPEGTHMRRFYWEVRLPPDDHILVPPSRWSSQQRWQWNRFSLERMPIVSRDILSGWVRADTAATRVPGSGLEVSSARGNDSMNVSGAPKGSPNGSRRDIDLPLAEGRAVYSSVGTPGIAHIWIVQTWLLVLVLSGPVLALGLAFVYAPVMRQVSAVLSIVSSLAVLATIWCDLLPLLVQAALPGVALSFLAAILHAFVGRDQVSARPAAVILSSSSLTRALPLGQVIIPRSSIRSQESVATTGRSVS